VLLLSELIDENEKYEIEEIIKNNDRKMSCNIRLNERITHLSIINEYQNIT
jgi:hypothetical protein